MSTQIKYSCPKCNYILSDYSKKGFPILHSGIGLPYLICSNCGFNIFTKLKPWSDMGTFKKIIEIIKTSLNILIICSIFGGLFMGGGMFLLVGKSYPFFETHTEGGRFNNLLMWFAIGTLLLSMFKFRGYRKYHIWVEKQKINKVNAISLHKFLEHYPDW